MKAISFRIRFTQRSPNYGLLSAAIRNARQCGLRVQAPHHLHMHVRARQDRAYMPMTPLHDAQDAEPYDFPQLEPQQPRRRERAERSWALQALVNQVARK